MESITSACAVVVAIAISSAVVCITKWLSDAEQQYPRGEFPITHEDQSRGTLCGAILGIAWALCDLMLNRIWQKPTWVMMTWEIRFIVFTMLTLGGCVTLGEIFRVLRCRKDSQHRM